MINLVLLDVVFKAFKILVETKASNEMSGVRTSAIKVYFIL